jgi:lipoyl(octanoyl) transferase
MQLPHRTCRAIDLGRIGYAAACDLQERLVAARKSDAIPDILLFCEHPHVLTLGRNGRIENLRASRSTLESRGVEFHHASRGGDITYHGPGQIVGYPIVQLAEIRRDVGWYVRQLEEVMIRTATAFGVDAFRVKGCTGAWTHPSGGDGKEKIGAIGVHISRWVTSHGFAFNVCPDLNFFDLIVPCGIAGCRTTSLARLLGRPISTAEALPIVTAEFARAFDVQVEFDGPRRLAEWLSAAELQTHSETEILR